ncbi:hypothetical protein M2132_000950 [Dysgonomonas sp. PH5-45]|nr:hypothetical protein [Dysgonomonas sp. PH5-45]MDH6387520.1 hypothetical protein [Dysgonomonas sp. PH5-37]
MFFTFYKDKTFYSIILMCLSLLIISKRVKIIIKRNSLITIVLTPLLNFRVILNSEIDYL